MVLIVIVGAAMVEENSGRSPEEKCLSLLRQGNARKDRYGHCRREVPHLWGKYATGRLKQVLEIRPAERRKS